MESTNWIFGIQQAANSMKSVESGVGPSLRGVQNAGEMENYRTNPTDLQRFCLPGKS